MSASLVTPSDVFGDVLRGVLASVLEKPWLVALLALMTVSAVVRLVRGVIHGLHPRDPVRRFSQADKRVILGRAGHRCEHHSLIDGRCRATEDLQADHVHPHSRGGATSIGNGQALCPRHNKQKSARVPWNWELRRLARRRGAYFPPGTPTAVVRHRARA
ncbi:HNH endonuclease [Geodermatophilus sp. SYSU D01062]